MSIYSLPFKHRLKVFIKPFLFIMLFGLLIPGYAQKPADTKPGEAYNQAIKNADKLLQAGDYLQALKEYKKAQSLAPAQKYPQEKMAEIGKILSDTKLNNQLFDAAITNGEKYFNAKNYKAAKTEYMNAMRLDPEAQFPKDKIIEIAKLYTDPEDEALYNSAVTTADNAFNRTSYDEAIIFYKQSLTIKPFEKYPKNRIAEATRLRTEQDAKRDQYNKVVTGADKLFEAKKYPEARAEYVKAVTLLPKETYPSGKIAAIDQIAANAKAGDDAYAAIIQDADKLYIARDFENARLRYEQALKMRPNERYPKSMLEKADMGETTVRTIRERYDAAITNADNFFKASDMDAALLGYQSAASILPDEAYPKTKIAEINKIVSDRNSRQDAYRIAIANGDQAFNATEYPKALGDYKNALSLQPNEDYPKTRIAAIEAILLKEKELQDNYTKAIAAADKDYNAKKYPDAITGYQSALALKPAEKYPQDRITEINGLLDKMRSVQENYDKAIADADKAFGDKNYTDALASYKSALGFKASEKYPQTKITEINGILSAQKALEDNYAKAIAAGDKAFGSKDYTLALTSYKAALALKPAETYPQEKITETDGILAQQKTLQENYDKAIASADKDFADKKYTGAIAGYTSALDLKPGEKYPQGKINEINTILGQEKSKQENYDRNIAAADKAFGDKKYTDALAAYKSAKDLIPAQDYPQTRITEINSILAAEKAMLDNYKNAIALADKDLAAKKYPEAITGYQSALAIKADETYPQQKITEINAILDQQRSVQENYDKAIAEADKALAEKNYSNALAGYQSASGLKPTETYPKGKISEINTILGQQKAMQDSYYKAIAGADANFAAKKYTEAVSAYQSALSIKPDEAYPQDKITEINGILAQQKALQENYDKAIAAADKAFGEKTYPEALTAYQSALSLKPAEKYPQQKITEINNLLGQQKATRESYDKAIASADKALSDKKYSEALAGYQSALGIIPGESYPQGKITEVNEIIAGQKAIQDTYDKAIAAADKDFGVKNYPDAISGYTSALKIKPGETYPQQQLTAINGILDQQKALQASYDKAVADADKNLAAKSYTDALAEYQKALGLKPNEAYPKGKITEINTILGQQKTLQENYDKAIALADKDLAAKNYTDAIKGYQSAIALKPEENYPKDKITEINGILAQQKALQESYEKAIAAADKAFGEKSYPDALAGYQSAQGIKPAEKYPQDKITEINTILGQQKTLQENYDKAIATADKAFAEKEYAQATTSYQSALSIKPGEKYPQDKLAEIAKLTAQQKTLQDNYDKAIATADKAFAEKSYQPAITAYQQALALKPSEKYPQQKIDEINGIFEAQKTLNANYDKAIASADKVFAEKNYTDALAGYQSALALKPAETYPQQKVTEINGILGKQKAIDENYDKTIAAADKSFTDKDYTTAMNGYKAALLIKPAEKYPQDKIADINAYFADQKSKQADYDKAIVAADKALSESDYTSALGSYGAALALKPGEKYPQDKIKAIKEVQAQQKAVEDQYNKAIANGDKAFGEKNYGAAIMSYQLALGIKLAPGTYIFANAANGQQTKLDSKSAAAYPQERITAINKLMDQQKALDANYDKAVAAADKALADKDYSLALTGYQNAQNLKPGESYPKEKISAINAIFAQDEEKTNQRYNQLISQGDAEYAKKNYADARSAYQQASGMKPGEAYPKDKLTEIINLLQARNKEMKDAYDAVIVNADKAYATRVFDQAIDLYENARNAKPDETYPDEMIAKIRKYMSDHSIVNITNETFLVRNNTEKRYSFKPVNAAVRRNNYVVIKARNPGASKPKVYLNYGRDNAKNGGIVMRSITSDQNNEFIIRISVQDKWYREDNNWIGLWAEGGDIEVSSIQIAQGDE
jgi:hypothetical protein